MLFISYARTDYYFAESLAFQLMHRGLISWLDAKDLEPGADWSEQLDAALDAAQCLLLVVSPDSLASRNVRKEWQRAQQQGKRIIAVLFRKQRLPEELGGAEVVDFRGAFTPALAELIARLSSAPAPEDVQRSHRQWMPRLWPPWVTGLAAVFAVFFAVSMRLFLGGDDWGPYLSMVNSSVAPLFDSVHPHLNPTYVAVPLSVLTFASYVKFTLLDFVFRRMGMTRLALTLVFMLCSMGIV